MSQPRPTKRARVGAYHQASYHDTIPMFDDFSIIHSSEGGLRNVGGSSRPTRVERSSNVDVSDWQNSTSWSPPDDENYALDPDGQQFNNVVQAEIMAVEPPPMKKQKKKRSVVAVSALNYIDMHKNLPWARRTATASRCVERAPPPGVFGGNYSVGGSGGFPGCKCVSGLCCASPSHSGNSRVSMSRMCCPQFDMQLVLCQKT